MNDVLFLIVGESASGKDTIVNQLCKKYGYKKVVSYTTRPKRKDKNDSKSHIFVSDEQFSKLNNLVAYTFFDGHKYGVTADQLENNDIYIIDKKGINYLQENYEGNKILKVIYVSVPKADRYLRMIKRGDNIEVAMRRIKHDEIEFKGIEYMADHLILNTETIDEAVNELQEYITSELEECV